MASLETLEAIMHRMEETMNNFIDTSTRNISAVTTRVEGIEKREILANEERKVLRTELDAAKKRVEDILWKIGIPAIFGFVGIVVKFIMDYVSSRFYH